MERIQCLNFRINTLGVDEDERPHNHPPSDSEDSDEGRQGFFVGGSEHSGQQVLGPNDADRRAQSLFDAVRRAGAEELTPEEAARIRAEDKAAGRIFQGGGHRLGTSDDPGKSGQKLCNLLVVLVVVNTVPAPQPARTGPVSVRLILWQNGFSINEDGPLRAYEDPANQALLVALRRVSF